MRFSIRDLLGLTVAITIYLLAYAVAPVREWRPWELSQILSLLVLAVPAVMSAVSQYRTGRTLTYWRKQPWNWILTTLLPGFSLSMAVLLRLGGQTVPAQIAVLFVAGHLVIWVSSVVTIGSNGIASGPVFRAWKDYEFSLEEDNGKLRWQRGETAKQKGFGADSTGEMLVPNDLIDEVRAILGAKQNGTTDHADGHG